MVSHVTRHSVADWASSAHRIGRHDVDEWWFFQKSDFQVELFRPIFWRHVTVAGPNDILNVQAVLLPRMPIANLPSKKKNKESKTEILVRDCSECTKRWMSILVSI